MSTTDIALPSDRQPAVSQTTAVEQHRAAMEVQAAVVVAQNVPRDIQRAEAEMRDVCGRLSMAERAFYSVPNRGRGPSVHLARELARIWGNFQYGVHELRRDDDAGMSEIQAFAWDVQTNTRSTRTFQVPHQRMVKVKGKQTRQPLVDLGDVYLNNQNIGARAVRECIFAEIPIWFTELAQNICNETLRNGEGEPLSERIEKMVGAFGTMGVDLPAMETRIAKKRGTWDAGDVATFKVIYTSLTRGETTTAQEFPPEEAPMLAGKSVDELAAKADAEEPETDPWNLGERTDDPGADS